MHDQRPQTPVGTDRARPSASLCHPGDKPHPDHATVSAWLKECSLGSYVESFTLAGVGARDLASYSLADLEGVFGVPAAHGRALLVLARRAKLSSLDAVAEVSVRWQWRRDFRYHFEMFRLCHYIATLKSVVFDCERNPNVKELRCFCQSWSLRTWPVSIHVLLRLQVQFFMCIGHPAFEVWIRIFISCLIAKIWVGTQRSHYHWRDTLVARSAANSQRQVVTRRAHPAMQNVSTRHALDTQRWGRALPRWARTLPRWADGLQRQ